MADRAEIKAMFERNVKVVSMRPSKGRGTSSSIATLGEGLSCTAAEGAHTFHVAMPEQYGGTGALPSPGALGRAALASCLVLGIAMWAVRMDIVLDELSVEVEADYDVRGELGVSPDVPPGYTAMRYAIRVASMAPESTVRAMVEKAVKTSSYLDNFARGVAVSGEIHVNGS
jgi:uncharacterized OsmC-like protein